MLVVFPPQVRSEGGRDLLMGLSELSELLFLCFKLVYATSVANGVLVAAVPLVSGGKTICCAPPSPRKVLYLRINSCLS